MYASLDENAEVGFGVGSGGLGMVGEVQTSTVAGEGIVMAGDDAEGLGSGLVNPSSC